VVDTRGRTAPVPGDSFPLSRRCVLLVSKKHTHETSSGHAVIPTEREPRTAPRSPPPHLVFRQWPYTDAYPQSCDWGTTWDLVGQMFTPFSPGDPTTHPACPPWRVVHPTERGWFAKTHPQRCRRVRTLTHMHGRLVMPPTVSSPGHFDTTPYGMTLAAYPSRRSVRAMTAVRGRTRTGRMWFQRTAPFET